METKTMTKEHKKSNIITIVRIRPNLKNEDEEECISLKNKKTIEIKTGIIKRLLKVQIALDSSITQKEVFSFIEPLLMKSIDGLNISLLTYGQTGSGKTYTMFGKDWNNIKQDSFHSQSEVKQSTFLRSIELDQDYAGIIPRCIHLLFDQIITKRKKFIKVYCSFLEIFNQQITDLLSIDSQSFKHKKLIIHQNKQDGIYVEGLNQIFVQSPQKCLDLMLRGQNNRAVRQTRMNIKSSRSHTILTLLIQEIFPSNQTYRRVKINLCDLAGSQKILKGEQLNNNHFLEMKNINLSLTSLGKVISALSSENAVPPFRESKLTRLLQDSLGGNTNTVIIATITSKKSCVEQSLNTLKFLERARQIKGEVIPQIYSNKPEVRNLEKQVHYLRDIIKTKANITLKDIQLKQKLKKLQIQNTKLRQIIDEGLYEKLLRQNIQMKQELNYKKNDQLVENTEIKQNHHYKTVQNQDASKSIVLPKFYTISSAQKTNNFSKINREKHMKKSSQRSRRQSKEFSHSSKHEDKSIKIQTPKRIGKQVFPQVSKNGPKSLIRILDRIMDIERIKKQNKVKLQKSLESLNENFQINQQNQNLSLKKVD